MIRLPVPVLETERLRLRGPEMADLQPLAAFMGTERARFVGGPISLEDTWRMLLRISGQWHLRGYGIWLVEDRASGALAGYSGVLHHIEWPEPELGWTVFPAFEGKGIAFEAARAARAHAAQAFGISAPVSMIDPANDRSQALARRLGATFEGTRDLMGSTVTLWRHPAGEVAA
jgi:RimJ/RimL family protein N-acetyltransferase